MEDVRSGCVIVGVVGEISVRSERVGIEVEGLITVGLSESPRAGRSTRWPELKDEPDVSGESCVSMGGDEVKVGSMRGRLSRADISTDLGGVLDSESLRFASAFLFLGTSCSLNGSVAEFGPGEAC